MTSSSDAGIFPSAGLPERHRYLNRLAPTPLVPVQLDTDRPVIWCKLEFLNPSGSTKDRVARFILEKAWRQGRLRAEDTVVEASSGSTSIALALACAQMGLRFLAVMPEGVSGERVLIIRGYGGQVRLTPAAAGIRGALAEVEQVAGQPGFFLPRQFANPDNAEAHRLGTAREIVDQLPGGCADGVVSGVGTGGTLMGLYLGMWESGCHVRPFLARPINWTRTPEVESCSFSGRIPGVAESLSSIFRPELLPTLTTLEIPDDLALDTTRRLMTLGFPVGPSSGLNYQAALVAAERLGGDARVVTVFPDRMERYFTTELFLPYRPASGR
jgi:cysteine synthase A